MKVPKSIPTTDIDISDKLLRIYELYDKDRHLTLSSFVKPAIISAPVFIEENLVNENISIAITKNLLNLYASFIMMVFDLDKVVEDAYTVRDSLNRVSVEEFKNELINNKYIDIDKTKELFTNNIKALEASKETELVKPVGIKSVYTTGRLLGLELSSNTDNKNKTIPFKLYTQFINRVVTRQFVDNLVSICIKDKYKFTQYLAGEITFWNDLVFGMKKVEQIKKTLAQTPDDQLDVIYNLIKSSNIRLLKKILHIFLKEKSKVNVFNNIWIISDSLYKTICTKNGLNYKKISTAQKLMFDMRSLFLVVVDQMNQMVTINIANINLSSNYTYKEMMSASSEKSDMFEMMNIFEMLKHGSGNAL